MKNALVAIFAFVIVPWMAPIDLPAPDPQPCLDTQGACYVSVCDRSYDTSTILQQQEQPQDQDTGTDDTSAVDSPYNQQIPNICKTMQGAQL